MVLMKILYLFEPSVCVLGRDFIWALKKKKGVTLPKSWCQQIIKGVSPQKVVFSSRGSVELVIVWPFLRRIVPPYMQLLW